MFNHIHCGLADNGRQIVEPINSLITEIFITKLKAFDNEYDRSNGKKGNKTPATLEIRHC
jgi:hypothetical protein